MKKSFMVFAAFLIAAALVGFTGCAADDSGSASGGSSSGGTVYKRSDGSELQVGDIFMDDEAVLSLSEYEAYTGTAKAVAVFAGKNSNDVPLGLGIINSYGGTNSGRKQWAPSGTTGYNTRFTNLYTRFTSSTYTGSEPSVKVGSYTFYGNIDGSDDWAEVCAVDSTAEANEATNYPAFNYANNYGTTAGLTGKYAAGWYMPSLAELYSLYQNKTTINASLAKISGSVQLYSGQYWSSSQGVPFFYTDAWGVDLYNGDLRNALSKGNDKYVCCFRAFN